MSKQETYGVPVGDRIAFIGRWEFPQGKYANFATMHQAARDQLTAFMNAKARIEADERLTAKGKREEVAKLVHEFDQLHKRFQSNAVADRKGPVQAQLRELRGSRPRAKDDVAGTMLDMEARAWYASLKGDKLAKVNFEMTQGQHPEIAGALLRAPDRMTGLRRDLREQLEQVAVAPENLERVGELRQELEAIETAEGAFERVRREILGQVQHDDPETVGRLEADRNLAEMGLQKSADKPHQLESFEPPELEPLPTDDDGVVDLKIAPNPAKESDAA